MGPTWALPAPAGPHVGPINLAIRDVTSLIASVFVPSGSSWMLINRDWRHKSQAIYIHKISVVDRVKTGLRCRAYWQPKCLRSHQQFTAQGHYNWIYIECDFAVYDYISNIYIYNACELSIRYISYGHICWNLSSIEKHWDMHDGIN